MYSVKPHGKGHHNRVVENQVVLNIEAQGLARPWECGDRQSNFWHDWIKLQKAGL